MATTTIQRQKAARTGKAATQTRTGGAKSGKSPSSSPGSRSRGVRGGRRVIRTYRAALDFLNSLDNYERRPPTTAARARGVYTLARIKRLLADLEHPERAYKSVHIAGTKGKGSTATMLASMLQNTGMKVGLYTSPHVLDVRERIAVGGKPIGETAFARIIGRIAAIVSRYREETPSYFEVLTAAAFEHFRDEAVDIAVVEVGMGGRFDATNVLRPEVCAVTSISYDHTAQLGSTLEQIATEKAGIFREGVPIVSAPQSKEVKAALRQAAEKVKAPLRFAGTEPGNQIELSYRFESSRAVGPQARICVTTETSHFDHLAVPLLGEHQATNCGVAVAVLDQLKNRGLPIDDELAIGGLAKVRIAGRLEMICSQPRVVVDVAHNAASIEATMRAIGQNIPSETMVVIFGCCMDKDVRGMLRQVQLGADKIIFTRIKSPRAMDPADLAAMFQEENGVGRMAQVAPNLATALEIAQKAVTRDDLICITGSFYLVGEAKRLFADHPHRVESTSSR